MRPFLQFLPQFKGKFRLGKLLYSNQVANGKNLLVEGKGGCKYRLPNLKENLAYEIFVNGIYEPDTQRFLNMHIPENGFFLDLGANIGSVSIPFCKSRKDVTCIAVEAVPWIFENLTYNVKLNQLEQQITCVNNALFSEDDKEMNFFTDDKSFGKGSLSPVYSQDPIKVRTVQVDSLLKASGINHVDFLKVDIEGYEYHAFLGAKQLLSAADAPDVFFEFADWTEESAQLKPGAAQELLMSYGYSLFIVHHSDNLEKLESSMKTGSAMLFATKKRKG